MLVSLPFVLASTLLAAAPLPAASTTTPDELLRSSAPGRDWGEPPPGSTPEDAALWRRLHGATNDAVLTMGRVAQCAYRLRYGGYVQGLDAATEGAKPEVAARAKALRAKLEATAKEADAAIPREGLRVRLCKHALLDLEQRMNELSDPKTAAEMPQVREEAAACADEVGAFARNLEPRAAALEGVLTEVDVFLNRSAPQPQEAVHPEAAASEAVGGKQ